MVTALTSDRAKAKLQTKTFLLLIIRILSNTRFCDARESWGGIRGAFSPVSDVNYYEAMSHFWDIDSSRHLPTPGILKVPMPPETKDIDLEIIVIFQPLSQQEQQSCYNAWGSSKVW